MGSHLIQQATNTPGTRWSVGPSIIVVLTRDGPRTPEPFERLPVRRTQAGQIRFPVDVGILPSTLPILLFRREGSVVSYCAHAPSTKQNLFDPEPVTMIVATG